MAAQGKKRERPRTSIRRLPKRGVAGREVIDAILDEALVSHLGICHEGRPHVVPTLHARIGDDVYVHGSAASKTLRAMGSGIEACLTTTLIDGMVLARCAFRHSVNYRSVMLFGTARLITGPEEKRRALRAFTEQMVPGRWEDVRGPNPQELKATVILALPIEETSTKVRVGPPADADEDYALPVWAGVIPLRLVRGPEIDDPQLRDGIAAPEYVTGWSRPSVELPIETRVLEGWREPVR